MRCEAAQEHFSDYCDSTMLSAVQIPLESHLRECDRCRREIEDLKQVWKVLDRMPVAEAPADFRALVWQRIDADAKARADSRRLRVPSFNLRALFLPRRLGWAAAAAAVLLLAGIGIPGRYQQAWLGVFGDLGLVRNAPAGTGVVVSGAPTVKMLGAEQVVTVPLLYRGAPTRVAVRLLSEGELVSPGEVQLGGGEHAQVIVHAPAPSLQQPVRFEITPIGDPSHTQTLTVPLP